MDLSGYYLNISADGFENRSSFLSLFHHKFFIIPTDAIFSHYISQQEYKPKWTAIIPLAQSKPSCVFY